MIHEDYDYDGGLVVYRLVCGYPNCGKVLRTWQSDLGTQELRMPDYMLLSIDVQVWFSDSYGRPLRTWPPRELLHQINVDVWANLDDRIVGYRLIPGTGVFMEDYCSDRCASNHLADSPDWGLCMRRQSYGSALFVAHVPDRFRQEGCRVDWSQS